MDMDGLGTFARVEEQSVRSDAARPYSGDILSGICTLTLFSQLPDPAPESQAPGPSFGEG